MRVIYFSMSEAAVEQSASSAEDFGGKCASVSVGGKVMRSNSMFRRGISKNSKLYALNDWLVRLSRSDDA